MPLNNAECHFALFINKKVLGDTDNLTTLENLSKVIKLSVSSAFPIGVLHIKKPPLTLKADRITIKNEPRGIGRALIEGSAALQLQ